MAVLLFVSNSVRTRTELLGTNIGKWNISLEFNSFVALPHLSKSRLPWQGSEPTSHIGPVPRRSSEKLYHLAAI